MNTKGYSSYEEAVQDYLGRFRALRDEPPALAVAATRGAGDISAETLIQAAGQIADVSASMVPLAKGYLAASDPTLREGVSGQLLAQAAAELQVATELLTIAAGDVVGSPAPIRRGARRAGLLEAINNLENALAKPVSDGLVMPDLVRRGGTAATTPEEARKALQLAVSVTTGAISQRVVEVGGDLAYNLVFNTQWAAVIQSAGLLSKDIDKLLERVKEGASQLIQSAVKVATRTLLNVFDKILALLGKDVEDQARKQIQKWLGDMQKAGKIELFEKLVGGLYKVDAFKAALPGWLEKTTVGMDVINTTTTDVAALSDKFTVLVGRINTVGDVIGLAKFIQTEFPQVLVVVTAIRIALLAVLVYGGFDYIGYGQGTFLNLTKGVSEVVRDNLGVMV